MAYQEIYEIGKLQLPTEFIICLMMFVVSVFLLISYIQNVLDGNKKIINYLLIVVSIVMLSISVILGVSSLKYGGSEKRELSKLYYSGDYSVTEGPVYGLVTNEISQEYYVNNVYFRLSRMDETIWDIEENGQQVRVSYISGTKENGYEYNQIVKLEILK